MVSLQAVANTKQQIYLESLNVKLIAQLIFIVLQIQENLLFPFFNWRNPEKNHSRMFAQLLLQHVQCMLSQLASYQQATALGRFCFVRVCVCVCGKTHVARFSIVSQKTTLVIGRLTDRQAHSIICLLHRHATTYVEQQQNYIHIIASEVVTHRPPTTIATTTIRFLFSNSFSGIKRALDNKRSRPVSQADGQTGRQTDSKHNLYET